MASALDLAYKCHREYLDADSADCGPIEDYIAKAIEQAVRAERIRVARECADIASTYTDPSDGEDSAQDTWLVATAVALAIRRAFPEAFEEPR